ncbi:MAG: arginine--tRNA ligase [Candidatus Paceibacterota bacterium]|jgi:arginyl-tRNA synthetase
MKIQEKIKKWIKETLEIEGDFVLAHPKDLKNGDYSFFATSKLSAKASTPEEAVNILNENKIPEIEKIEVVGKFINFYLSKGFFVDSVKEILDKKENYGKNNLLEGQKILIEHTQPNPFKEFHIGHLMNNAVGESVFRILDANGAEITAVGYHGDVGLHVAKTIWGKMQKPELSWGEAYAYGSQNFDDHKIEITEINKKVYEKSDQEINKLYENGKKDCLDYFESLYKRLDSHFDFHFFESETGEVGQALVMQNVGKVFENGEGGAVIFKGENFQPQTHTRVFINSEGIPTYEAKEVGLAKIKKEKYDYDKSITVTANEQDAFFDVTEVAIGEVRPELKGKLKHLSHGMLRLPSGKMSSRTGEVITAENLIEQVKEKVFEKIKDREFDENEKQEIAEIVAVGAIKYSVLRQAIGGDIIFDFDKSISFEGDSGPYLQYACVRANSVLEKAKAAKMISSVGFADFPSENTTLEIILAASATELEKILYRFEEVVERAGQEYAPHHIVTYLTELASVFNSFYANNKIIDGSDTTSPYKIALTTAVAHTLRSGLHILGIKVPEKM